MTAIPRFGDFGFQTVVDTYQPNLADIHPGDLRHGMGLQAQYFYGGLRDDDGVTYMIERKFAGPMTNGIWLMSDASGETALLPEAMLGVRGEAIRVIRPDYRRWDNHLLAGVGEEVSPSSNQPLTLELDGNAIRWDEGHLLHISGAVVGPGFQIHAPARDEPMFYTTQYYWVEGTVLGKAARGFIGLDHSYFAHGSEWKEYRVYTDLEISWTVFLNRYEDTANLRSDNDSMEYGVIVTGRQGFSGAVVFDGAELVARTNRATGEFVMQDSGDIDVATLDLETATYAFTQTPTGSMPHFSKARWAGYRAQAGVCRRVGDDRVPVESFSWTEFFPERIRDEGLLRD